MNTKKANSRALSMLLALILIIALAVPTFAADPTTNTASTASTQTFTATGALADMKIQILVPTGSQLTLNPYQLNTKIKVYEEITKASSLTELELSDTVLFAPQFIINRSNVPMKVSVVAQATGATGVTFAATAAAVEGKTMTVNLGLVAKECTPGDIKDLSTSEAVGTTAVEGLANINKTKTSKAIELAQLEKAEYSGDEYSSDGTGENVLAFGVIGAVSAGNWSASNAIGLTLTFTFEPITKVES